MNEAGNKKTQVTNAGVVIFFLSLIQTGLISKIRFKGEQR